MSATDQFQDTWLKLQPGLVEVLDPFTYSISYPKYMELYTHVYNYCTRASNFAAVGSARNGANLLGGELYFSLRDLFQKHLEETLKSANGQVDEPLLHLYSQQWKRFTTGSTLVHHIFKYLNRHWIPREIEDGRKNVYDVYTLSLVTWKDTYFAALQEKVIDAILKLVEHQRNGQDIDTNIIKAIMESYVSLGLDENDTSKSTLTVYKEFFEAPFIARSRDYYAAESKSFLAQHPVTEFLKRADVRLKEEEERLQSYLHNSTHDPLIKCVESVLIADHQELIQNEFQTLLNQDRLDDLARMFALLVRVPGALNRLRDEFEAHVKQQGLLAAEKVMELSQSSNNDDENAEEDDNAKKPSKSKSSDQADPKVYVESLLAIHKKFADLTATAFRGDAGFSTSLDKACREFVNRNSVCKGNSAKSPELLARFCDALLRKGTKIAEDAEVDNILNQVMILFKYVEDKDVFQKFYSQMLAKRLVNQTSASDDSESSMITKLKEACGFEYTSKLQKMFTDMGVSKDISDQFKEKMDMTHTKDELIDFGILVLSTAAWPLNPSKTEFNIPSELLKTFERFQGFYGSQHNGRKLTWLFHHSKGEIKTNYLSQNKTFMVSTHQMGILLQYNSELTYTFEQLQKLTNLSEDTLNGNLKLFLKAKVLLSQDGKFVLNTEFKNKKIRLNLNLTIRSEQKAEIEETHKDVEEDRKFVIQAAIVRVMKTRKSLKHQALVNEVISQLSSRFMPKVPDIKKNIDLLIEKEYLERTADDRQMYNYLA